MEIKIKLNIKTKYLKRIQRRSSHLKKKKRQISQKDNFLKWTVSQLRIMKPGKKNKRYFKG